MTMLNMFKNCISYTNAQRYINTIAIEADQQLERDVIFIPKSAKLGNFTHFATDNVYFHEDTKDGKPFKLQLKISISISLSQNHLTLQFQALFV